MENASQIAINMAKKKIHKGPIHSHVAGRTDHLPMHVASGSYVIPADIISALGEGNSVAGFKIAKDIFEKKMPYGVSEDPYGARGLPYGVNTPRRASGGAVPIVAAGGEFVVTPESVMSIGKGSMDDGHKILDQFVTRYRAKTIKTLSKLPGPVKD